MPVNTVPTSVQCAVLIPFDRNIFFAVLRIFDFCIGFNPVYALTMLIPKTLALKMSGPALQEAIEIGPPEAPI